LAAQAFWKSLNLLQTILTPDSLVDTWLASQMYQCLKAADHPDAGQPRPVPNSGHQQRAHRAPVS
jgi:hypothetical protein